MCAGDGAAEEGDGAGASARRGQALAGFVGGSEANAADTFDAR